MKAVLLKSMLVAPAVVAVLSILNCASIFSGTTQAVKVDSTPPQAKVEIISTRGQTVFTGITPASTRLQRKFEYTVNVALDGYQPEKILINKDFNAMYLGNLLCGGIIGFIVDAVDGSINKLEPDMINVTLVTAKASSEDGAPTETYAVLHCCDDQGAIQTLVIPLTRN